MQRRSNAGVFPTGSTRALRRLGLLLAAVITGGWTAQGGQATITTNGRKNSASEGPARVICPAGSARLGCLPGDEQCFPDEHPSHRVLFSNPFWIDATEVTWGQYRVFAASSGRPLPEPPLFSYSDQHPVVNVSWHDAATYCAWRGGRLPSEAEWEYAARGGVAGLRYPWGQHASLNDASYQGTGGADTWAATAPVGSFPANALGLFDVAGNVWEWCSDWFEPEYYAVAPEQAPAGPPSGTLRILRGGSWKDGPRSLRLSNRGRAPDDTKLDTIGFRCAGELTSEEWPSRTGSPPAAAEPIAEAPPPGQLHSAVSQGEPEPPATVARAAPSPAGAEVPSSATAATAAATAEPAMEAPAPARTPSLATPRSFPPAHIEMVWVPPGEVELGCVLGDPDCDADEQPRRAVRISRGFWMGVAPVTVGQFRTFAVATGDAVPGQPLWNLDNHPIVNTRWQDAAAYCRWAGGRLPTEAEWEHAARGGRAGERYVSGSTIDRDDANGDGRGGADIWEKTAPVASFPANHLGLHDMAGNVWEWCTDWYSDTAYASAPEADPRGPDSGLERVVRGGSWTTDVRRLRISYRYRVDPADALFNVGFRCVRDDQP